MNVVVITGVNRGLGKAFFDIFAKKDFILLAISRTFTGEQIQLRENDPSKFIFLPTDLANFSGQDIKAIEKSLAAVDVQSLVFLNNASVIEPIGPVGKLDETRISNSFAVNLMAPIQLINFFISKIDQYNKIKIINISSGAALKAINGWAVYCSSKAGLRMFVDTLKLQCEGNSNLLIENVDPGLIDTQMQAVIRDSSDDSFPEVAKFRSFKENDQLQAPKHAAEKVLAKFNLA